MDAYQQGLRELLQKGRLSPLDVKEGMIAAYVYVTRLNQSQGNPSVGLQQKPEGLYGHLKGFMGAIFWERGYDFDNPSLEQLAEVKIMTDGMAQVYAMPDDLQYILNNLVDYLLARGRGTAASLAPEVSNLLGISAEPTASEPLEKELMPWEEPDTPPESPPTEQETAPAEASAETPAWETQEPAPRQPAEGGEQSAEVAGSDAGAFASWATEPSSDEPASGAADAEMAAWEPTVSSEAEEPAATASESPESSTAAPERTQTEETIFPWETGASSAEAPAEASAEAPAEVPFLTETSPATAWGEHESALISETDLPGQSQPEAEASQSWDFDLLTNEPTPGAGSKPEPVAAAPAPVKRPRGRPRKTPVPEIVPAAAEGPAPAKKRRGRKPKLVLPEGMEPPKPRQRRKPRQKELKIDLAAVQVPDDFMTDDGVEVPAEALAEVPPAQAWDAAAPETLSDEQLLTDITSQWQPEPVAFDQPVAAPHTTASEPVWDLAAAPEPAPTESSSWDHAALAEPTQVFEVQDDDVATAAELLAEPEAPAAQAEPEPGTAQPAETEWSPEASPSSWRELGGTEMEPEKIASAFSQSDSAEPEHEAETAEPPRKRGGGVAGFMLLVLGLMLGGGGAYYWFGVRENQTLQMQLDEAKKSTAAMQQQLSQAQEQAKALSAVLNAQREASKRPLGKPKYFKVGKGVVLYWTETDVVRKYNLYYAKGKDTEWIKVNEEPLTENVVQFKQVANGVRRYAVAALDKDGQETARSEELTLKFPLK